MPTKHTIYQMKYDAENRRNYGFRLHNKLDADIIEKLASVPSMQGYIKDLIRRDLEGGTFVPLSDAALEVLTDEALKRNRSVSDLIALIVNEYIIRNK